MPWPTQPVRRRRRPAIAAAVVVVLVAGIAGYLLLRPQPPPPRLTGCVAGTGAQALGLTPSQAGIAATIAGVAARQQMPARAVAVAYAAALQESKLANLNYGDQDSVGIFQQRPSQGWGTARQIEDPVYATTRFFQALSRVPDYQHLAIATAAQDVQRSADGSAYAQYAGIGTQLASDFTGAIPHQVWCSYAGSAGRPQLAAAAGALAGAFGPVSSAVAVSSTRPVSRTVELSPRQVSQGWALASWLVAHAASYGITSVRYQGYQWFGFAGSGRWTREPTRDAARADSRTAAPASAATVVYG